MAARPAIKPALPDLSRLFVSVGKGRSPSADEDTAVPDTARSAVNLPEASSDDITVNGTHDSQPGADTGSQELGETISDQDKDVAASTASPVESPSMSTPATQEFAIEDSTHPLQDLKTSTLDNVELVQGDQESTGQSAAPDVSDPAENHVISPQQEKIYEIDTNHHDSHDSFNPALEEHNPPFSALSSITSPTPNHSHNHSHHEASVPKQMPLADLNTTQAEHDLPIALPTENNQSYVQPEVNDVKIHTSFNPIDLPATARTSSTSVPTAYGNWRTLNEYFLNIAVTKDYADFSIQVYAPVAGNDAFAVYGHSVILARSNRLRRLMARSQSYGNNIISLYPPRRIQPHAFDSAVRFLYSDALLAKDYFNQQAPPDEREALRKVQLDYIVSYWISGVELGLDLVTSHGEALLSDLLDWDLLESVYKIAIEIARSDISSNGKYMTGSDYFNLSNAMIRLTLHFIANHLDVTSFKLDIETSASTIPSRLPTIDDGRPRANPVLASMVFGSMPSSSIVSDTSPILENVSAATALQIMTASSILLNLDFENLYGFNVLLQRRGVSSASRIMTAVVAEREARRVKVLNAQNISNRDRMAASSKWDVVGHQESFSDGVLSEKRVGFLLPTTK